MNRLFDIYNKDDYWTRYELTQILYFKYLSLTLVDKDPFVRVVTVSRINCKYFLYLLKNETNINVRRHIINKIDDKYLCLFINDIDHHVRQEVAKRIDPKYLPEMLTYEKASYIIQIINKRLKNNE